LSMGECEFSGLDSCRRLPRVLGQAYVGVREEGDSDDGDVKGERHPILP
jgi:hypothetical protein